MTESKKVAKEAEAEFEVEEKAPQPKKAAPAPTPKDVIFISRDREDASIEIMGIRPIHRSSDNRLVYEVPAGEVERFERHFHVQRGRVQRQGK
jgi:hypothetical protein